MFQRLLPAFAVALSVLPAFGDEIAPCEVTPDSTSCSRIFACIGSEGDWFEGRAIGRGTGVFDGTISDGVICSGSWTNSNALGLGQADMTCSDGRRASVYYYLQDGYTGTGIGRGVTNTGQAIQSWTGENVLEFFRSQSPDATAVMRCNGVDILVS